jgi:transposase
LFAALEVATGRVHDRIFERYRHEEFLVFLRLVATAYPRRQLHLILDNYGTHTHPEVRRWLERHPRIHLHFTPSGGSWLNLVETFFSITTKQAIRRGSFRSVKELMRGSAASSMHGTSLANGSCGRRKSRTSSPRRRVQVHQPRGTR